MNTHMNHALAAKNVILAFFLFNSFLICAETITITTGTDAGGHTLVPIGASTSALGASSYNYATQQIYLASELGGSANAGEINSVSFHYKTGTTYGTARSSLKLYINTTSQENLEDNTFLDKGTLVYSSSAFNVPSSDAWYELPFSSVFEWDGTSNIVVTFIDESNTMMPTSRSHWAYTTTAARSIYLRKGYDESLPATLTGQTSSRKDSYVANAKFSITLTGVSAPAIPSDLAASATTENSISLAWSAVSGATSYELQSSANGSDWSNLADGIATTAYNWSGLSANTTYYVRVRAVNAGGNSEWSDALSVTTDAAHIHDGITFAKWNATDAIPTSGNYYLANDVTITGVGLKEISSSLNLCLNGHTIAFTQASGGISVTGSGALAIFDEVGGGLITSPNGTATIQIASGGSLAMHAGNVTNTGGAVAIKNEGLNVSVDLAETADNAALLTLFSGQRVDVNLNRSFTSAQFNTICLPFSLANADLTTIFGSSYDLEAFVSSTFDGETIELTFSRVTSLEAGKPYLIQPSIEVANPTFTGATISATAPSDQTSDSYISFHGVLAPTSLEGGNHNLLFLGPDNELLWPAATDNLKGFRAYFEVKGAAKLNANRARIVTREEIATGIEDVQRNQEQSTKELRNGTLVIIRGNKTYNAQGQLLKPAEL